MATDADYQTLVLMVGSELLTEEQMKKVLDDNEGNFLEAASAVWEIRAGKYHALVDITESGSSRKNSDLHKNALSMAKWYRDRANPTTEEPVTTSRSGTRRIVRE